MDRTKVSIKDPMVRELVTSTFPEYKGRKIVIAAQKHPLPVRDFGGGGTFSKWAFVNLADMEVVQSPVFSPFNDSPKARAFEEVMLPEGILAVEHAFFCGKDTGITIYANPANLTGLLAQVTPVLTAGEMRDQRLQIWGGSAD